MAACASETGDDSGTGGTGTGGAGTGGAISGTGGAITGTGGAITGTGGAITGTGGAVGTGGGSSGTCTAITTGLNDEATGWWAGTSEMSTDAVIGTDGKSISDTTGIAGVPADNCWANVAYAFGAAGACVDGTGATSISIDVTSAVAGSIRIALKTEASTASSNHHQKTETFTAGETKTVTLSLDGTGLTNSWADPAAPAWDPGHILQIVVIPLATGTGCLAPYDISAANVTVN